MSMSQFNRWLKEHGVTRGPRGYRLPCLAATCDAAHEEKADDGAERRLRVTMSTNARDRHGDILEPGGAQIAGFLKNPVVLWAHDYRALPIGRVASLVRDGDALKADILFAATPFAEEVRALYLKGFLRAWSVGFLPLEWEVIEDPEGRFAGYHIKAWELIELSAVPVPANPEALTDALNRNLVNDALLVKSLESALLSDPGEGPAPQAEVRPARAGLDQPEAHTPDVSLPALATLLAPKLLVRLRPCLGAAVAREIRRRQGKLD